MPLHLVMVHGLIGSPDYFDPASGVRRAEIHTLDLLGYGSMRDVERERLTLGGQAAHVAGFIEALAVGPVWLLGHSMGGAIVMMVANRHPDRVAGIISVEGNFTLADAFWSRRIAALDCDVWEREFERMRADPVGWLTRCGVERTDRAEAWGHAIVDHQPAGTLHAMSRAIVAETGDPSYLEAVRRVVRCGIPLHLVAGERSASAWDVPDDLRQAAASYREQPGAGHMMMLDAPDAFCRIVDACLGPVGGGEG